MLERAVRAVKDRFERFPEKMKEQGCHQKGFFVMSVMELRIILCDLQIYGVNEQMEKTCVVAI